MDFCVIGNNKHDQIFGQGSKIQPSLNRLAQWNPQNIDDNLIKGEGLNWQSKTCRCEDVNENKSINDPSYSPLYCTL